MKKINFTTAPAVCSTSIDIEIDDNGKISFVRFNGGCHGSLQAVSLWSGEKLLPKPQE